MFICSQSLANFLRIDQLQQHKFARDSVNITFHKAEKKRLLTRLSVYTQEKRFASTSARCPEKVIAQAMRQNQPQGYLNNYSQREFI